MLLGQANNKVAYFQCLNVLNISLNSKSDARGIFNIFAPLLSRNSTELFGCQFWKQVLDNTKVQREILLIFKEVGKTKINSFYQDFQQERNNQQEKVLETITEILPSTFSNATTTKMAEKYNETNCQQIKW